MGKFANWSKIEIGLVAPASFGNGTSDNRFQIWVDMTFLGPRGVTHFVPAFRNWRETRRAKPPICRCEAGQELSSCVVLFLYLLKII